MERINRKQFGDAFVAWVDAVLPILAVEQILAMLDLTGAAVSVDEMGYKKTIASQIKLGRWRIVLGDNINWLGQEKE